jgi:hypothetical protein
MRSAGGAAGDGVAGKVGKTVKSRRRDGQTTTSTVRSNTLRLASKVGGRMPYLVTLHAYAINTLFFTVSRRKCTVRAPTPMSGAYARPVRDSVSQLRCCCGRHEWVDWNSRITGGGHAPSFSDSFFVLLQGIGTHPVPLCLCSHSRIFKNTLLVITMKKNRLPWSHAKVLYPIRPPTALIPSGFGARPSCLATCAGIDRLRAVAVQ